jgi:hypothetical protein
MAKRVWIDQELAQQVDINKLYKHTEGKTQSKDSELWIMLLPVVVVYVYGTWYFRTMHDFAHYVVYKNELNLCQTE